MVYRDLFSSDPPPVTTLLTTWGLDFVSSTWTLRGGVRGRTVVLDGPGLEVTPVPVPLGGVTSGGAVGIGSGIGGVRTRMVRQIPKDLGYTRPVVPTSSPVCRPDVGSAEVGNPPTLWCFSRPFRTSEGSLDKRRKPSSTTTVKRCRLSVSGRHSTVLRLDDNAVGTRTAGHTRFIWYGTRWT